MGKMIRLKAKDGHELDAYVAEPKGKPKGGIVVVQEIFGVTDHIKRVADQYAAQGYRAIAPAMFDRVERNVIARLLGRPEGPRVHARAAVAEHARRRRGGRERGPRRGQRAVVGYCWGGTVAHVAASELELDAAVSYYGGGVAKMLDKKPRCPIMYHFGDQDRVDPAARHREDQARESRQRRCSCIQAPGTGSIATSAAATARKMRSSRSNARSSSWTSRLHETQCALHT